MCKYGDKCYRKNKQHLSQFKHQKRKGDEGSEEKPAKKAKKQKSEVGDAESSSNEEKVEEKSEDVVEEPEELEEPDKSEETEDVDESDSPPTPSDVREEIKVKFKVGMPEDFYEFWEFCQSLDKKNPTAALHALGLELVGPFDILAGKFKNHKGKKPCYVLHWRYFYDPPEFMTVVKGDDKSQYHLGYYRDDPKEMPAFVAANSAAENCNIKAMGENLFAAVKIHLDKVLKETKNQTKKGEIKKLDDNLTKWAKKSKFSLEPKTKSMKNRDKKVVTKTFHGAGIVVPVVNDVGYRPLPETDASLKKILKKIVDSTTDDERTKNFDDLQEIITLVQFANDECDYGEGYELGIDLFCNGSAYFHSAIDNLLPLAYTLLGRDEYAEIITKHLKQRKKTNLSQLV
ncbi:histone PARylation factor 1-like [Ptychodera flava]|uniref:histone PARylation factor 1-like n=1 Tax=Ptychodera flava TaxID=63121 RepID=UPI00396A3B72